MELVKSKYKIRCEMGTCKKTADYELVMKQMGHNGSVFICKDCLEEFYFEAARVIVPRSPTNMIKKSMDAQQASMQPLSAICTEQPENAHEEAPAEPSPEINPAMSVDCAQSFCDPQAPAESDTQNTIRIPKNAADCMRTDSSDTVSTPDFASSCPDRSGGFAPSPAASDIFQPDIPPLNTGQLASPTSAAASVGQFVDRPQPYIDTGQTRTKNNRGKKSVAGKKTYESPKKHRKKSSKDFKRV